MSQTIGIDLGGSKVALVRLDAAGTVVERAKVATPRKRTDLSAAAIEAAQLLWTDDVAAVGAGIAGLVRWPEGVFAWGPHVAGDEVPVAREVAAALGVPVAVDNDANTAAYGEAKLGAARGYHHVLMITLGTGIGGGIVIDGEIYRGRSFAGEFGHMILVPEGAICDCGRRGCWETVASGPALARMALEVIARNPRGDFAQKFRDSPALGEAVTAAAGAGDETARALVAGAGAGFGAGIANLIAALDPDIVVVGGGLGAVGEALIEPARRVVAERLHGGAHRGPPPIVVASLGAEAGAIGAALLARTVIPGGDGAVHRSTDDALAPGTS